MTWAERVGDLATNITLVVINLVRIFTMLFRIGAERVDGFVTGLAQRSELGIAPTEIPGGAWVRLPASVFWGVSAILLRVISIFTVFVRQLTTTVDEFFRVLAEGEGARA
ncbi:MAG: hypothetical protein HYX99_01640 [Chloroflexi bacterium]|nr:hypothetical protein [Chloroflexota bacterium]